MSPKEIQHTFNPQSFLEQRANENVHLTQKVKKEEYCLLSDLLIILSHFYQTMDTYARLHPAKRIKVEDVASQLKTIRTLYIHPDQQDTVATTCQAITDEINELHLWFKKEKLTVPPTLIHNTLYVVAVYEEQYPD